MHMEDAASLERQGREQLERATTAAELEDARVEALGRSSALTLALRELGALPAELRGARGQDLNRVRAALEGLHSDLRERFETRELDAALRAESIDVTLPGDPVPRGTAHILTQIQREIEDVFVGLGFGIAEGPEVELEYYNFTALNTPEDHPSRAESDTLWISADVCLRTQTSPVQVRVMESQPPPVYVICPGRVYRRDTLDPTHSPMFQQVEGIAVDKGLSLAHLKGTLEHFARALFGPEREIRLRSHYFPFTEPSVELDVSCFLCGGEGCRICSGEGWIEILGAGMIDPNVFGFVPGYDPEVVTGWAFGMGIERVAMLKYGIPHVKSFYDDDVRFLEQFRGAVR
jgi:phenylalanyl-tRNA synthetase alpha chain